MKSPKSPNRFKSPSNGIEVNSSTFNTIAEGLKYLGEGVSKTVYALDKDHVLKINARKDENQIEDECKLWEEVKDTPDCEMFAAIVAYDHESYSWSVMERCVVLDHHYNYSEEYYTLCDVLTETYGIDDWVPQNFGRDKRGELKVIDYAR